MGEGGGGAAGPLLGLGSLCSWGPAGLVRGAGRSEAINSVFLNRE